jgi:hypothetical protein
MKPFLILLSFLSLTCCKSKYDNVPEGIYESKPWSFVVEKEKVILMNRNNIGAGSHGVYHKPQNYDISLPRKMTAVGSSGSSNFINYGNGQVIMVDADYKSKQFQRGVWKNIVDEEKVFNFIKEYYSIFNKKREDNLEISKLKPYTMYFDGQTYILFYNIKNTDKFNQDTILKSFRYIE